MVRFKKPACIPSRPQDVRMWNNNFAEKLPLVVAKYEISEAQVAKVVANAKALDDVMSVRDAIGKFDGGIGALLSELLNFNPSNLASSLTIPALGELKELKGPMFGGLLIEAARVVNHILSHPGLTNDDLVTLGIMKEAAAASPVDETKLQPALKGMMKNGKVVVKITKGRNNQKYGTLLQVDKEGKGHFADAGFTAGLEWMEDAMLPDGVLNAVWAYRAVFLDGQERIGEWAYCTVLVSATPLLAKPQ